VTGAAPSPARLHDDRRLAANALRVLCADAVEAANSGHPGAPLGMADIAEALWRRGLKHNPRDPAWPDRDRFVLSNGHASMLLYALLHLTGYDLPLSEIRRFRQAGSATPGHPEHGLTPGVETTTGPLGQGLANAVGMALAEKLLAQTFNRPGFKIVDHRTFVFVGDGCLMEGVSHEAASFAGVHGLEKLIVFYDDNGISIDGPVAGWFADDTPMRFEAYGWRVIANVDGHDAAAIESALARALRPDGRPTLVCCKTVIGRGAPSKSGSADAHGAPLGTAEIAGLRAALDWRWPPFDIPEAVAAAWDAREAGAAAQARWSGLLRAYRQAHPDLAAEFQRRVDGAESPEFASAAARWIETAAAGTDAMATRKASLLTLEALSPLLPELLGGSADLTESNQTKARSAHDAAVDHPGSYVHYGVREFGMSAIMNGVALHGGFIPFGGTFLVFTDYARNALRLSALMRQRVIYVLTHDSIGLGEDGPTHQPIEQLSSLRLIPDMDVWRPCDLLETAVAWRAALERRDGPTCLVLSRQACPAQPRDAAAAAGVARGGYVLAGEGGPEPDVVLIATGAEVELAMGARTLLAAQGLAARVVSLPSVEVFERQPAAYRLGVLPDGPPRVAIEAGATGLWWKHVGLKGAVVGIDRFGASAPAKHLFQEFGFTAQRVADAALSLIET
jgi:transketolase